MTAGLTIVRAEPAVAGRQGAQRRPDRAAWPWTLRLRSPGRCEEVQIALAHGSPGTPDRRYPRIDEHVVAELRPVEDPSCRLADVIVGREATSAPERPSWISSVFARYPACAVSATAGADGAALLGLRDGRMIRLIPRTAVAHPYRTSVACASFVHFWTATGQTLTSLDGGTLMLRTEVPSPCRLTIAVLAPLPTRARPLGRLPGPPAGPEPARPVVL